MGGCVSVNVSERLDCPYDGVMALGAALLATDSESPIHFSHAPQKPLLFITNSDEITLIEKYQADCAANGTGITPATWTGPSPSLLSARLLFFTNIPGYSIPYWSR